MEHNSYLLEEQVEISVAADGPIGTAANTVDIAHHFGVTTTADRTLTLPNPTINRDGWSAIVTNEGNFEIQMYGILIEPNEFARFIYDNNVWHSPASKPVPDTCPAPMTRAALRALRTSGGLSKDCHYVLTDYNRGTVGTASILLHAVDENTLSMTAKVKTTFDTLAWDGRYDIDTNRLENLSDNLGNEVTGNTSVDSFPWGVRDLTDNRVRHGFINHTGGTVTGVTVGKGSALNIFGGSLTETVIDGDSDVTIRSGFNYDNTIRGSSTYNQVGTGTLQHTTIADESSVTNGDVNILDNTISNSTFNMTGSSGTFYYNQLHRFTANAMQNVPNLRIDNCSFSANSQMTITGAARIDLRQCTMSGYGRFLVSAGATLLSRYTGLRDYSYIQVIDGQLTTNYCSVSNLSYIQHNTPGTNGMDSTTISNRSNAQFLGTSTGCRIHYCEISSGSRIYHTGTSTGCYFYYCEVTSSSQMYSQNSVNLRAQYNTCSGNSQYYSLNVTATHYAYYNSMSGHGYIRHQDSSGGRIYAVSCHGQGLLRLLGATPTGRVYYSSFTAYYYLYANNWTLTRHSLHGHGRRTYTVTNPPNGTFTQNF